MPKFSDILNGLFSPDPPKVYKVERSIAVESMLDDKIPWDMIFSDMVRSIVQKGVIPHLNKHLYIAPLELHTWGANTMWGDLQLRLLLKLGETPAKATVFKYVTNLKEIPPDLTWCQWCYGWTTDGIRLDSCSACGRQRKEVK